MNPTRLLGLPLSEALCRLEAEGITPEITISLAPRRSAGAGALRIVQAREGGRRLVACAFINDLKERSDG